MNIRALNIFISALSALFFISGFCLVDEAEAEQFVAQPAAISKLSGKVEVLPKGALTWEEAKTGMPLNEDDQIRTAEGAKAELVLQDGSFIRLKEKTTLGIKTAREEAATKAAQYKLDFRVGEIMAELKKLNKGSTFEVETPTAVVAVRGTIFYLRTGIKLIDGLEQAFTDLYVDSDDILYFTNIMSGETYYVHQSQDSTSYGDGTTEVPETIPPAVQDGWRSGWEIEEQADTGESDEGALEEEEEEEEEEAEDETQEGAERMTNVQFAGILAGVLGLELPAGADALSDAELFEVLANMLAEMGITLFIDMHPDKPVARGNVAEVLYNALFGPSTATTQDKINYLADLGYMKKGRADKAMKSSEIIGSLNNPALSKAVAEAYSPPGEGGETAEPARGADILPPPPPANPAPETPGSPIT